MLNRDNLLSNPLSDVWFTQLLVSGNEDLSNIRFMVIDNTLNYLGQINFTIRDNITMLIQKESDDAPPWLFANKYPYFTAGLLFWYPISSYPQMDEPGVRNAFKRCIKDLGDNYFKTARIFNNTDVLFTPPSYGQLLMNFLKQTAEFSEVIFADDERVATIWDFVQDI